MRWLAVVAVLAAGCVETGTMECPGGSRCPEGTLCVETSFATLCAPGDAITACEAKGELAGCRFDANQTPTARCYALEQGLVCLPSGCGNGFIDPSEVCDDRNQLARDGCSIDCSSDETCGNGIVDIDVFDAEQCDDGDHLSNDGCSSGCRPERPRWSDRVGSEPPARVSPTVAFDPRRGRIVLFGGRTLTLSTAGGVVDSTLEWDDRGWTEAPTLIRPGARSSASSVYDDQRRTVLMFGGVSAGFFGDTWEWTGGGWHLLDPTNPPSPRYGAGMVADTARDRVVMFGGAAPSTVTDEGIDETWLWRDAQWTQLTSTVHPPRSARPMVAYDSVRGVTVVWAGGSTWELGETWVERGPAPGLPPILDGAFDPIARRVVAVGQRSVGGLGSWEWDGVAGTWNERANGAPLSTSIVAVLSDPVGRRLLLVGWTSIGLTTTAQVEVWEPTGWRVLPQAVRGNPGIDSNQRIFAAATAAPTWGTALVFGGVDLVDQDPSPTVEVLGEVAHDETWSYDGAVWVERQAPVPPASFPWPPARSRHALAFDPSANVAVLFGGRDGGGGLLGDTWTWDGNAWSQHAVVGPSARAYHVMAYDPALGKVILFGGVDDNQTLADTWSWDGAGWSLLATPPELTGRAAAALAFDPIRNNLVLYGGARSAGPVLLNYSDETWTFSGIWQRSNAPAAPSPRGHASLAWDAKRGRLVLVGGAGSNRLTGLVPRFADTWEWDGNWHVVAVAGFRPRVGHVAFPAPDGAGIVVVAGYDVGSGDARYPMGLRWEDELGSAGETCIARVDQDGDGRAGCNDPDCWTVCTPLCPPGVMTCPSGPACGDATCSALEIVNACPADCGAVPQTCGDLACDPGESCVGDCAP